MKKSIKHLAILILVVLSGCANQQKNDGNMNELKLRLNVSYTSAIGYGDVYRCQVIEVIEGEFLEKELNLTIMVQDNEFTEIIDAYQTSKTLVISFEKEEENVPYNLMPISGMVDKDMTSWKIKELKRVE